MALIAFPENLIITSLSEQPFEESIPFKSKDLMGIGSSDYHFESELINQSQIGTFLFCASAGILELKVSNTAKPEMRQ
jgi:hypothetical protein